MLGDGAMGTLLYERGLPLDRSCEELVLTRADEVRRVHEDYIAAGAQLLETNTFAANRVKLAHHGLELRVSEINLAAARLAVSAASGRDVWVAGAVGSVGLTPGEAQAREVNLEAVFHEQVIALLEGGVDALLFETFSDLEELRIAMRVARKAGAPVMLALMSFTEDGFTHRGVSIGEAFSSLQQEGARVVGANCCVGPHALAELYRRQAPFRANLIYAAYPNAGRPQYLDGRYVYVSPPAYFAERGRDLLRSGVRLLGGCCGTGPAHIAALKSALETWALTLDGQKSVVVPSKPIERASETREEAPVAPSEETLVDIVRKQTLIVTEFDSPKTLRLDIMMKAARALKAAGTDFLTVADNSLAILRMNCVVASHLVERETGVRTIVHLACRDRNLIGTQSELMGMDALGLTHVLALTGDPSKVGDSPGAASVYDLHSISLLEGIRSMNQGRTFGGRDLKRNTRFVPGCSFNPNVKNLDVQVKRLERKVASGAQFVMTQPIFDRALAKITREVTAAFHLPVLVGVMPLLNARNTEFLHNEVPGIVIPDAVRERMRGKEGPEGLKEGVMIAREIAAEVLEHFKGIYFITPLVKFETTVELCQAVRTRTL